MDWNHGLCTGFPGDVVYVELPEPDSEFHAGEAFGVVRSVKLHRIFIHLFPERY